MKEAKNIFLDDVREVYRPNWIVLRSYKAFVAYIKEYGVPELISFDYDLGEPGTKTGYDCALFLVENNYPIKEFYVHSMNPVGAEKITQLLNDWKNGIKPPRLNWEGDTDEPL